ncbi:MAG: tetratricopeptide (TPR) repeat protein, partial [Planctomycetota bacterium]
NQEEEAEVLLLDCLDKRLAQQGEEHPDTLQLFQDLATLYSQQGRSDEAEGMYSECLALREAALGESDPMTLVTLDGLVWLYADNERWKEAAPLSKRLVALTPEESPALVGRKALLQLIKSKQEE